MREPDRRKGEQEGAMKEKGRAGQSQRREGDSRREREKRRGEQEGASEEKGRGPERAMKEKGEGRREP